MQWQPRSTMQPAAGLLGVPEPGAVRARVRLPAAHPHHVADGPGADGGDRLDRLRGVDEVLEVAGEDAGRLDERRGSRWPRPRSGPAASCTAPPCRPPPAVAMASACRWLGRPTTTVSTSGCSTASSMLVVACGHAPARAERRRRARRSASRRPRPGRGRAGRAASSCRSRRSGRCRAWRRGGRWSRWRSPLWSGVPAFKQDRQRVGAQSSRGCHRRRRRMGAPGGTARRAWQRCR